ncbi:Zinc finger-like protein [Daphnia magna]|uniref:Zinc finger-like protein n=1 Tax=Daphnia magna TaxID=35525 RepID=A0A162DDP3_9CRUS|nr:Zinc finger-like protein [Daphnia magna]
MVARGNYPITLMDTLQATLKTRVNDSAIVSNLRCGRTKTTALVKNVIGPAGKSDLVTILKSLHFSIIVDETTDRTTTKFLVTLVRYFNEHQQKPVEEFFSMPVVSDATAAGLKVLILAEFEQVGIRLQKMIGFAADNCSVMLGYKGGLGALLKNDLPWLTVLGCICHSFSLCSSAALEKLDKSIVQICHDVHNFIAYSSKRKKEFKECQEFLNAAKHSISYPCKNRWFAFEGCNVRMLEQWGPLELYFQSFLAEDNQAAKKIYCALINPKMKLHYSFLAYVLPLVNKMNVHFQSEKVEIHRLLSSVEAGLRPIMDNFIRPEFLRGKSAFDVDHTNPRHQKAIIGIYYGAKVETLIMDLSSSLCSNVLLAFRISCLTFYIELFSQIKMRVNHKDDTLIQLQCIDPKEALSGKVLSIAPLFYKFRSTLTLDIEEINTEWWQLSKLKRTIRELDAIPAESLLLQRKKRHRKALLEDLDYQYDDIDESDHFSGESSNDGDEEVMEVIIRETLPPSSPERELDLDPAFFGPSSKLTLS